MTTSTTSWALLSDPSRSNMSDVNDRDPKPMGLDSPDCVLATVSGILVVIMALANLINVPYFVKGDGTCLKPVTFYIIGLMIVNLGIASVCQTMMTVIVYMGRWPFSYISCSIFDFLRLVLENTGVWLMVLISLDKLQLLCYDYPRYVRVKRKRRIVFEVVMTFVTPMLFHLGGYSLWILTTTSEERADDHSPDCQDIPAEVDIPFVVIGATINIFIPGLAIMVMNSVVFYKIKQRLKKRRKVGNGPLPNAGQMGQIHRTDPSSSHSSKIQHRHTNILENRAEMQASTTKNTVVTNSWLSADKATDHADQSEVANSDKRNNVLAKKNYLDTEYRRYIRPAVTLAGLVATFSICWFPLAIYHIYVHVFCPSCFNVKTQIWLRCLMYANSALNPFIYISTNRQIRKFHGKMFRKVMSRWTLFWE
nr:D(2) dopamine receptor-like [Lytechinus pictus]